MLAVAEAVLNLLAAPIELSRVKLSANWMAACGQPGQDAALFDTVEAVGMELCPALGLSIPVGKDSLSMRTTWKDEEGDKSVTAPVSLIVSAFATLDDVRGIAARLRPGVLDDLGLVAALTSLCTTTEQDSGIRVHRRIEDVGLTSHESDLATYRIAQEALTNVVRHAGAHRVWVTLRREDDRAELSVQDDGVGLRTGLRNAGTLLTNQSLTTYVLRHAHPRHRANAQKRATQRSSPR